MSQLRVVFGSHATFGDVATAFAIAGGASFEHINPPDGVGYIIVRSLTNKVSAHTPEMVTFEFVDDKGVTTHAKYHFEWDSQGQRGVMLAASPKKLAMATAVVNALGGKLSFEGEDVLLEVPNRWPEDSEDIGYDALKAILLAIKPVSDEDIAAAQRRLDEV